MRAKCLVGSLFLCLGILNAESHFWDKQDPGTWTRAQSTQFVTSSPWAKAVTATLVTNDSNMAAAAPRSAGGRDRSVGSSPSVPSPSSMPSLQAVVHWVSAKPMRQALHLHLPPTFDGRYVLCVSGLPFSGNTDEVAQATVLQVKRGEPVHPEVTYQDPNDTSAVYFGFLPSTIDLTTAKIASFSMVAEPYSVRTKFNLAEMKYRGEPAF